MMRSRSLSDARAARAGRAGSASDAAPTQAAHPAARNRRRSNRQHAHPDITLDIFIDCSPCNSGVLQSKNRPARAQATITRPSLYQLHPLSHPPAADPAETAAIPPPGTHRVHGVLTARVALVRAVWRQGGASPIRDPAPSPGVPGGSLRSRESPVRRQQLARKRSSTARVSSAFRRGPRLATMRDAAAAASMPARGWAIPCEIP